MKRWSINNVRPRLCFCQRGVTLIELLLALAVGSILTLGLFGFMNSTLNAWQYGTARMDLLNQANFAMNRMVDAVSGTRRVLIPLPSKPERHILAVTLPPNVDRNNDGIADADNDGDGLVDEDIPEDNTNDGEAGIVDIDDDEDGNTYEHSKNNDEDGAAGEDLLDGEDNDEDGAIDEDIPANNTNNFNISCHFYIISNSYYCDNDGDGYKNEDWLDPQVFYVSQDGKALMERLPKTTSPHHNAIPTKITSSDYDKHSIAEAEKVTLNVKRIPKAEYSRGELIKITLTMESANGGTVTLETSVRIGSM